MAGVVRFFLRSGKTFPDPADFLNNLKRKGGFDQDQASNSMKAGRYTVTDIGPIGVEKG